MHSDTAASSHNSVGVIGATGLVGDCLLPLLLGSDWRVIAFSRRDISSEIDGVEWQRLQSVVPISETSLPFWICLAPIWTLPEYFAMLEAYGAKRVVALSSTSRFTKVDSSDPSEQDIAHKLVDGERRLQAWAESKGIEWNIIRPTLIYGLGRDRNISEIARFICRWGFFPLLGGGKGLRQPVHVEDVAMVCHAATLSQSGINQAYNICGGEILSYKEMVCRVFGALEKKPRFCSLPRWLFAVSIWILRCLPRFRHWSVNMVYRMNRDMVFDSSEAKMALMVSPRPFNLEARDLPACHRL